MMVPRSYHFLHQAPPSSPPHRSEKMGARSARPSPSPHIKARIPPPEERAETMCDPASKRAVPTAPTEPPHSKPVVIPPRTPTKTSTSTQTVRVRGQHGGRNMRVPKGHRSDALPPAVAALLAVTEIPRLPARRRKGSVRDRKISMDELIQEWSKDDSDAASSVVGSPMDLLLGRVDESEDEYGSLQSLEQEKGSLSSRSVSNDSLTTIPPSLDLDATSFASNWDSLNTPDSYPRSERRVKTVQSPTKEECMFDHPLLYFFQDDNQERTNLAMSDIETSPPASPGRFHSFKSNLTASLKAMKSAAKSFSNFTAPSVPPEDLLTRSLLSPVYPSEMRPKQFESPSPALRRYLNPQPPAISPAELSMQLHAALVLDVDTDTHAPMIQMQTYDRRARSSSRRRKNDLFSEAGRALSPSPAVRQREPRENSNFLRVIVLEMNMRRVGKLDAKAVGKARLWLPPRKSSAGSTSPSLQGRSAVPKRWISTSAD